MESPAFAIKKKAVVENFSGVVISCHDGDTCRVKVSVDERRLGTEQTLSVRFAGIDAPEIKQPLGVRSKNFVESLIKNKTVNLECDGKSFNRITCTVFQAGVNINSEIVRAGWAYESKRYSKGKYTFAENQARTKKLGIWGGDTSGSPYCFRQKRPNKKCLHNPNYQD